MKRNGMMDIAYLLAPELPEKVPCLQAEHDDWPFGLAFPAEHLVHVTELPFENVPELHGVQDVAPLLTLLVLDPARHSKHTSFWATLQISVGPTAFRPKLRKLRSSATSVPKFRFRFRRGDPMAVTGQTMTW